MVASLAVAAACTYVAVGAARLAASGFALSLAGVAGLIVAIGITADSFIVYFERIRDEVREGGRCGPAVEAGWARARRTILAADACRFLAAVVLYFSRSAASRLRLHPRPDHADRPRSSSSCSPSRW